MASSTRPCYDWLKPLWGPLEALELQGIFLSCQSNNTYPFVIFHVNINSIFAKKEFHYFLATFLSCYVQGNHLMERRYEIARINWLKDKLVHKLILQISWRLWSILSRQLPNVSDGGVHPPPTLLRLLLWLLPPEALELEGWQTLLSNSRNWLTSG